MYTSPLKRRRNLPVPESTIAPRFSPQVDQQESLQAQIDSLKAQIVELEGRYIELNQKLIESILSRESEQAESILSFGESGKEPELEETATEEKGTKAKPSSKSKKAEKE